MLVRIASLFIIHASMGYRKVTNTQLGIFIT